MQGMTVDQVRATDVAGLAASLLGCSDAELLAADAECAEAMVVAAQRVIGAMSAVQALAIEAWGRREAEALSVEKVQWAAMSGLANPGGLDGARLRLLDGVPKDEHDFMPSYLAPVLRMSPRSAGRRYESARTLVGCLPLTLAAMRAGDLEPHRAQQVVDEVPPGDLVVCAAVERVLFPRIVDRPNTRVGALARKAVVAADPGAAAVRAEQAHLGRFVFAGPSGLPGLMRFEAEVSAGKGRQVWAAIEELAAGYVKEEVATTIDQARADAFVDLVLANVSVSTVVDLALPAGFASGGPARAGSCGACARGQASPAYLPTAAQIGAVAGGSALEAAATGVLVDADQDSSHDSSDLDSSDPDTGWLLDAGATTYHPGRHLARTVRKRDLHCRFPGCATAARFTDLDHVVPFPAGRTVLANLACLCRRHHRLKTHGHWSLAMSPDGVCTWVDRRTGLVHTTEPADYRDLAV